MEEKIRNLTFIVILGFIIMFILIIGLYFKDGGNSDNSSNNQSSSSSESENTTTTYDVSDMNEVNVDEAVALFEEDGTHVLYIGRSTCSVCVQFVAVLNQVQEDLGFTTNYLPLEMSDDKPWEDWQAELEPLTDLLTIEASANGEEGTLGELFYTYGFTPAVVVIQDGEVVEGFFGYRDATSLTELIEPHL